MPNTNVTINTEHASKYLQQLCKHFSHKVDVDFDANRGAVAFAPGPCTMTADGTSLHIHCHSSEDQGILVLQSVIESHLAKFAWREEFEFDWRTAPDEE